MWPLKMTSSEVKQGLPSSRRAFTPGQYVMPTLQGTQEASGLSTDPQFSTQTVPSEVHARGPRGRRRTP